MSPDDPAPDAPEPENPQPDTEEFGLVPLGRASLEADSLTIFAILYRLQNGILCLVSDQPQFGIGTAYITAPPSDISQRSLGAPLSMFGLKHTALTNIIGKRVSQQLRLPALSIVQLFDHEVPEKKVQALALQAVAQALEDAKKKKSA